MGLLLVILLCMLFKVHGFPQEIQTIKVKPGQTLWEISQIYLKDPSKWDVIVKYNKLPLDPYQVIIGKELKIPVELLKEEYRAAKFEKLIGDVRIRPQDSSNWMDASKVKDVFKGDTIKTGYNSYADIRFYTGQVLNIFANSMVVVKPPLKEKTDLKLVAGQIKSKDTTIVTVSAKITPIIKNTEIAAKIKEDLSTVVQVYKGEAEVEGKGKKIILKEGFTTEVKLNSEPSIPQKMPNIITANIPQIITDIDKGVISVKLAQKSEQDINGSIPQKRTSTPPIQIDINKAISGYHIQIAKDREFKNIVFDRKFDIFKQIDLKNYLSKGKYYFRIAYIDLIGFEGEFTQPKEIVID